MAENQRKSGAELTKRAPTETEMVEETPIDADAAIQQFAGLWKQHIESQARTVEIEAEAGVKIAAEQAKVAVALDQTNRTSIKSIATIAIFGIVCLTGVVAVAIATHQGDLAKEVLQIVTSTVLGGIGGYGLHAIKKQKGHHPPQGG